MQVLKERILGPDSAFQCYIDNLPMGVPGIPLFFSPDAIRALEQYPPLRYFLIADCCGCIACPLCCRATLQVGSIIALSQ